MKLTISLEHSLIHALKTELNLFLGAGFSVMAQNADGRALPVGSDLHQELVTHFELKAEKSLSLDQLCTVLEASRKAELRAFLAHRFSVTRFDDAYKVLRLLPISAIFTTNIDDLVQEIYSGSSERYVNDIAVTGPKFADKAAVDFVALHGSIVHPDDPMLFSALDLASAFSKQPDKFFYLTRRLQAAPTLFVGYSIRDAGVLQALNQDRGSTAPHASKWILLREEDDASRSYFTALGFNIIVGSTADLLRWISGISSPADPISFAESKNPVLTAAYLPTAASVPVRPITTFFSGEAPVWSDIFSGKLYRTSHFDRVNNAIHSGRHVTVLGMLASGKSTLLMQVASELKYEGLKLVPGAMTQERAQVLVRALGTRKAIVFLDDLGDNLLACRVLLKQSNIQVVAFERDYFYDQISHLLENRRMTHLDCTNLTPVDIQGLFTAIPQELRRQSMLMPATEPKVPPSLFEVLEVNMLQSPLRTRFNKVLADLATKDILLHDFLVMACYVHSCRVPVSFDIANAFLRPNIADYSGVYNYAQKLRSLLVEYEGDLVDSDQDYFSPRSSIVSEAVLGAVGSSAFGRVLTRFHDQVSTYRIVRFDVFRRRAYDEQFAIKAFPNWRDGLAYYEKLCARDSSPYLRQQAALYLARKQQYSDAFKWIDDAVLRSGGRIPSIRNSHAIILFKANINQPDKKLRIVSETLKRSMTILSECYSFDKRKIYHAMTFSEQAIEYWRAYRDRDAKEYLETAKRWLGRETIDTPWHRKLRDLVRQVDAELANAAIKV